MASVDASQWPFLVVLGDAVERERMYGFGCFIANRTVFTARHVERATFALRVGGEPLSRVTFEPWPL